MGARRKFGLASGVSDAMGGGASRWKTFGERVIYDNQWVWLGQVDVRWMWRCRRGAVLASRGAAAPGGDDCAAG